MHLFREKLTYCRFLLFPLITCVLLAQQLPLKRLIFPSNSKAHYCKINGSGCTCGAFCMCRMHHQKPANNSKPTMHSVTGCGGHNMTSTLFIFTLSKIIIGFPQIFSVTLDHNMIPNTIIRTPDIPFLSSLFHPPQINWRILLFFYWHSPWYRYWSDRSVMVIGSCYIIHDMRCATLSQITITVSRITDPYTCEGL